MVYLNSLSIKLSKFKKILSTNKRRRQLKQTSPHLSQVNCRQCGEIGAGNFCSNCGQSLAIKRITIESIFEEVIHFFTHLDRGFPYTLKKLVTIPGKMQKDYIDGVRKKYQKPFSMVFLCGTITAFALFLLHKPSGELSHFAEVKTYFIRHYYVIVQLVLLPFYALVSWLIFKSNNINYAESLVLIAYTLSFMLLLVIFTSTINVFSFVNFSPRYSEFFILFLYLLWTNINFFNKEPAWAVILKSTVHITFVYFASIYANDLIVNYLL